MNKLIFATRPSKLARWQTNHVISLLKEHWQVLICDEIVITTKGDKAIDQPLQEIGDKGLFTLELEEALRSGRVDAAVHSLKDLPTEETDRLIIGAVSIRAPANEVLICPRGYTLDELPEGAVVGTSSLRRQSQLLAYRPDINVRAIRGNVDTRIRKVQEGQYDAVILAAAGVTRLGLNDHITQHIPLDIMLPAPGQGALAVQCRADDENTLQLLSIVEDTNTRLAVTAERSFLSELGGGCAIPVGAYAQVKGDEITMQAIVASVDGRQKMHLSERHADPKILGMIMAQKALALGAQEVLHV